MDLSSENINLIMVGVAVIVGLFILFRVAGKILKYVLILVIAALVIYFWQGGTVENLPGETVSLLFKKSNLADMEAVNCPPEKAEKLKCECVVPVVAEDLRTRLSPSETRALDQDWPSLKDEIVQSITREKKPIRQCLVSEGGGDILKMLDKFWDMTKAQEE